MFQYRGTLTLSCPYVQNKKDLLPHRAVGDAADDTHPSHHERLVQEERDNGEEGGEEPYSSDFTQSATARERQRDRRRQRVASQLLELGHDGCSTGD